MAMRPNPQADTTDLTPWYLAPSALTLIPRVRPAIDRWQRKWISGTEHHAEYVGPAVSALEAHWGAIYAELIERGWPDDSDERLGPPPQAVLGAVFGDPNGNPDQPGYEWATTRDQSAAWETVRDAIAEASAHARSLAA